MSKQHRHKLIREIVSAERIGSQDALREHLTHRGVRCTQATLSRDLKELKIVRSSTPEGPLYRIPLLNDQDAVRKVVGMEIKSVRHNGSLVVLRTMAGRAQGVAAYIDSLEDPRILGTLAGDDTVFIAPTSDTSELCDAIAVMAEE